MTQTTALKSNLSRLFTTAVVALLVTSLGLGTAMASHAVNAWKAKDAKGRMVNTANFKGKVQIITISNPDFKYKKATDKTLEVLAGTYGNADDVRQLTIVDLRSMNWATYNAAEVSGELESRMKKAHARIAKRIGKALGKTDAASLSKIDKNLHLVPVREDKIIHHYQKWTDNTTENNLIIAVVDKDGKFHKFWKIKKGTADGQITATLNEVKGAVDSLR